MAEGLGLVFALIAMALLNGGWIGILIATAAGLAVFGFLRLMGMR
jgi:uncharacterized membrane protein YjjP (DUF1212 family)